jgi:hypothetical protein
MNTGKPIVMNASSTYSKDIKALGLELAGVGELGAKRRGRLSGAILGALGRLNGVNKKGGNDNG